MEAQSQHSANDEPAQAPLAQTAAGDDPALSIRGRGGATTSQAGGVGLGRGTDAGGTGDGGTAARTGPAVPLWRRARGVLPGWALPVLVIVVTAWLRANASDVVVVAWLALVAGWLAYHVTLLALEPELYAKRAAQVCSLVIAVVVAWLLLRQLGVEVFLHNH